MGTQGDFTITGYSSDSAMKDFVDGSSSITEGEMFAEGTADNTCVISSELASYNDLAVGDTITLSNPNQEDETYTLTIAGIYETESTSDSASSMMGGFMAGADSSNQIYVSYQTLETILYTVSKKMQRQQRTVQQGRRQRQHSFDAERNLCI